MLLCATSEKSSCCSYSIGSHSWNRLKGIVKELKLDDPKREQGIVLRSKVDCLRVCKRGPILLIWPDGIWYEKVTSKRIEIIIKEHIMKGRPIEEWVIKRTPNS